MKKIIAGIDYIGITTPFYCNNGKGIFVLHKRSKKCRDEQGTWDFGGGKLKFFEQPEEGVLREVAEEYGCQGIIQEQLPPISIIRELNETKTHWLAIPFFIRLDITKVKINDPEKIDELGFFDLKKLPQPLHLGLKKTMKIYQQYFDKYIRW
jgi:8-oxo-dGTP pyrophosphatase MutT (NUDIX family)